MMRNRVIFFDIDGTLLDHEGAVEASIRELHEELYPEDPPSLADFRERWLSATSTHIRRYLRGEISFVEQRRCRVRQVLGRELPEVELDRLSQFAADCYEGNWRLYDDATPCLKALQGFRLGIISNGDSSQQRSKLGLLEDAKFRPVVISGDINVPKPDVRLFMWACQQAGVQPQDCVYIGDQRDSDALAAQAAGMTGVWLRRYDDGSPVPDDLVTVASLDAFRSWLLG